MASNSTGVAGAVTIGNESKILTGVGWTMIDNSWKLIKQGYVNIRGSWYLMKDPNSGNTLPEDYTQVIAIVAPSGNAWIDTEYIPNDRTNITMQMMFATDDASSIDGYIFGSTVMTNKRCDLKFVEEFSDSSGPIGTVSANFGSFSDSSSGMPITGMYDLEMNSTLLRISKVYSWGGDIIQGWSPLVATDNFTSEDSLIINGYNEGGSGVNGIPMIIKSVQITEGGAMYPLVLKRDFIPVVHTSGQVGLFDMVEGKFYPSSGSEDFMYNSTLFEK